MLAWISRLFSLITGEIRAWVNGLSDEQRWATLFQQQYEDRQLMGALLGDVMNVCPEYWDIRAVLEDPETGLVPLAQRIATVEGKIDTLLARPAGTVGEPSNANTLNLDNVASSVWGANINLYHSAGGMLSYAGWHAVRRLQEGVDYVGSTRFKLYYSFDYQWEHIEWHHQPRPNWGDIQPTDTRLTWLQRTEPQFTWQTMGWHDSPMAYTLETNLARFILDLTEAEFNTLKAPTAPPVVLPADRYPGPGLVTWGTPLAFDDHTKLDAATYGVDGKMDGVLVLITATPPTLGLQQVEDVRNYFRLGWLVFEDEDANTDRLQWFGPDRAVYVPEAFASPANVVVSCKPGVSGTITPWVVTQ